MDSEFDAIELALDELDSINQFRESYSEWCQDQADRDAIADEVYLARQALEKLKRREA
jgi:hypothetical protein